MSQTNLYFRYFPCQVREHCFGLLEEAMKSNIKQCAKVEEIDRLEESLCLDGTDRVYLGVRTCDIFSLFR